MTITCGILGASGYTGAELLRLTENHPDLRPSVLTADTSSGKCVGDLYPHLRHAAHLPFLSIEDASKELSACNVVFSALPHSQSMQLLPQLKNPLIIDLGGDFRLNDSALYEHWYGVPHAAPAELPHWSYGCPELNRSVLAKSSRIANPGCFATSANLALAPLVKERLIEGIITIDSYSGTSGAGRVPKSNLHFAHVDEDVRAYRVAHHQHTPEIEQTLSSLSLSPVIVSFTAHLLPMVRGIHTTASATAKGGVTQSKILDAYRALYDREPFVEITLERRGTKDVRGSNMISITPTYDERTGRVIVTSVIDNLVKGASGQAIQNANIALQLPESAGLSASAFYP